MVLVITMLAALLAVGAVMLSLQVNSTKSTALVKDSRSALYCAEAGIAFARNQLTASQSIWNDLLAGNPPAGFQYPLTGDFDQDGVDDFSVTIRDDGDDTDLTTDSNTTIIVISECTKFAGKAPATVMEVISMQGQGFSYRNQSGQGAANTGNAN